MCLAQQPLAAQPTSERYRNAIEAVIKPHFPFASHGVSNVQDERRRRMNSAADARVIIGNSNHRNKIYIKNKH